MACAVILFVFATFHIGDGATGYYRPCYNQCEPRGSKPAAVVFIDGITNFSLEVLGRNTTVYKPIRNQSENQRPGFFLLPPTGGPGCVMKEWHNSWSLESYADMHDFLVVYPESKAGYCDMQIDDSDFSYLEALWRRLQERDFALNPTRAYVLGWSSGGSKAFYFANWMGIFQAAAGVECGASSAYWNASRRGVRAMVFWNENDPDLDGGSWVPYQSLQAYLETTVSTLRNHSSSLDSLPCRKLENTSDSVPMAELLIWPEDRAAPELRVFRLLSNPGTHSWPMPPTFPFDTTKLIVEFFLYGEPGHDKKAVCHGLPTIVPFPHIPTPSQSTSQNHSAILVTALLGAISFLFVAMVACCCKAKRWSNSSIRAPLLA
jgi:poly(3-hydroxybutyrate) depolymerase